MKIVKLHEQVENTKLTLNEDLEELTDEALLEFKHGAEKSQKYTRKIAKQDAKILKKGKDVVARDMSPKYRDAKIYLAKPDGTYEKNPRSTDELRKYYQSEKAFTDPRILNAVVVKPDGFMLRRGLEDVAGKALSIKYDEMKPPLGYTVDWPSEEETADVQTSDLTQASSSQTDNSSQETSSETTSDVKQKKKIKKDKKSAVKQSDKDVSSAEQQTQANSSEGETTKGDVITPKILLNFKKIAYVAGLPIKDVFGREVSVSSIKDLDAMKLDTLNQYEITVKGKDIPLDKWLTAAAEAKIIKEELDESLLTEAPQILLNDNELDNPDSIDFKKVIKDRIDKEEAEKAAEAKRIRKAELHNKHAKIIDKIETSIGSGKDILKTLDMLHDELVPPEGEAETVAGEIVRAMMRLLSRSYNDGDKFYSGYGLETCGSSAEYLYDMDSSFSELLQHIVDEAYRIDSNDDLYDDMLKDLTQLVIEYIMENPEFFEEENEEDSRNYHSTDWDLEEEQPRYEFEIMGSADVEQLVEEGIIDAWALNSYVESALEYNSWYNNDVEIERPWSHNSTTVTLSNLTKDAVEALSDMFRDDERIDRFWEDLVSEHEDELNSETSDDNFGEDDFDEEQSSKIMYKYM